MAGVLTQQITDRWAIYNADAMDVMATLPDASIHASIYSPPFAGLYHYSSSDRDVSNARNYDEFREHYGMFVEQIHRLTMPGRCTAVHAAPIPSSNSGTDSLFDFPGDVIRLHEEHGWDWIARHAIWKEPLAVRNRTMQHNLSHKTIVEDGALGGVASADELLIFRKRGASEPAQHPRVSTPTPAESPCPPTCSGTADGPGSRPRTATRTGSGEGTRRRSGTTFGSTTSCRSGTPRTPTTRSTFTRSSST